MLYTGQVGTSTIKQQRLQRKVPGKYRKTQFQWGFGSAPSFIEHNNIPSVADTEETLNVLEKKPKMHDAYDLQPV